jgi:aspartate aminotransferase-like enzyme
MRFEMNSEDVLGLSTVLHYAMKFMNDNPSTLAVNTLHSLSRLVEKIRNYGLEAYPNREVFRQDMNDLKSWRDELIAKRQKNA